MARAIRVHVIAAKHYPPILLLHRDEDLKLDTKVPAELAAHAPKPT